MARMGSGVRLHWVSLMVVAAVALASGFGCETSADRAAREKAQIVRQGDREIKRICALPAAEREAELQKIREESGVVLDCGR
jgi:hypothetical protein